MATQTILVLGGAGYIGSHTAYLLHQEGYRVIIVDKQPDKVPPFTPAWAEVLRVDLCDKSAFHAVLRAYAPVTAVMHFAAYIEVGESVKSPGKYYQNNVSNTLNVLEAMREEGVKHFIFSSTAAVYGTPTFTPLTEDHPTQPINPYGHTKLMVETILNDYKSAHGFSYAALRYFNAAGAMALQGLGERHDPESHVLPRLLGAMAKGDTFFCFGDDYDTPDGTCIRDYLHVKDIAAAHIAALHHILQEASGVSVTCNLGSGTGYSVKEIIAMAEKVCGIRTKVQVVGRRAGDPAILVADRQRAQEILHWIPENSSLEQIMRDAWEWESSFRCAT